MKRDLTATPRTDFEALSASPLDAALVYLTCGFAVYAPAAGSKLPAGGSSGVSGLTSKTATTDPALVREVYHIHPTYNVAARLDACDPQLCVLDLDTYAAHGTEGAEDSRDGAEVLRAWCGEHDVALPETWALRTASGGMHLLFKLPEGATLPKSRANLLTRVDFLGAGHGEVLPPSTITGDPLRTAPYSWVAGHSPIDSAPLAELPRPLYDLWAQAGAHGGPGAKGRNVTLASMCGRWWGTEDETEDELTAHALDWNARQADPLPEAEVCKVAASIASRPKAARRGGATQGELADFMRQDPELRESFGTNVLDGGRYVRGALPWSQLFDGVRRWDDADDENLFVYLQDRAGARSKDRVRGALTIVMAERRFNPLREYLLHELPAWDGRGRADWWLNDMLGVADSEYTRAVAHTFARGAVLRAMQPGCKVDLCLVLVGEQGRGKSLNVRRMALRGEFLCEGADLGDPRGLAEALVGRWFVELAELQGMAGRGAGAVKQELTRQVATVRLPYARHPTDLPRSCVFVCTTNDVRFLADPTGSRRFLPVQVAEVEPAMGAWALDERFAAGYYAQLWAEVVAEYQRALALPSEQFAAAFPVALTPDMEAEARRVREDYEVEDTDEGAVFQWLDNARLREGVTRVCARQVAICALGLDGKALRRRATNHVASILDKAPGWRNVGRQRVGEYGTAQAWEWGGVS